VGAQDFRRTLSQMDCVLALFFCSQINKVVQLACIAPADGSKYLLTKGNLRLAATVPDEHPAQLASSDNKLAIILCENTVRRSSK